MEITEDEIICTECGLPILFADKPCPKCNKTKLKQSEKVLNAIKTHKKALIISTISIITIILTLFFWIPKTPEYSVYMMVTAIKNQDIDTFKEYVDIDKVANAYVDDALNYAKPKGNSWADNFASGFMELMRPQLVSYISTQMENFVNNPERFNLKLEDINLPKIAGALLIKNGSEANISVENQGTNSVKLFKFENKSTGAKFGLKLNKNKAKHRYIIVAIDSKDLFDKLKNQD